MWQQLLAKYLTCIILVPFVKARSHRYSLADTSSVKYTDFLAYYDDTSSMQCLAFCDGHDSCATINYNLDNGRYRIIPANDAWQSSTYTHYNGLLSASYAIDGNRDNNDQGVNIYCAITKNSNSYWAMEFEYVAEVEYVIIYFRNADGLNDRNQNLRLLISATRQDSDDTIGTDCASFAAPPESSSQPVTITCTQPVTGKYLKIIHNNPTPLALCEVEVYSV